MQQENKERGNVAAVLLRVTLWMSCLNLPGTLFPMIIALLKHFEVLPADTSDYSHTRYLWGTLFAISEQLLCAQLKALKDSPYFGILMDSSTDRSTKDHILVYVRHLVITGDGTWIIKLNIYALFLWARRLA